MVPSDASAVITREIGTCSSPAADLFMKLGICGFDMKPRDALVKQANGDRTPPADRSGCAAVIAITRHQSGSLGRGVSVMLSRQ